MKKFRNTINTIIYITIIFFTLIALYNYLKDDYCVFGKISQSNIDSKKFFPNERMLKIQHILKNQKKYDSFIFASSKANKINLSNIENGNWYNCCFPMVSLEEIYYFLKLFKENDIEIKNILLQITDDTFRETPEKYYDNFNKYIIYAKYPQNFIQNLYCKLFYLFLLPDFSNKNKDIYPDNCKNNVLSNGSCTSNYVKEDLYTTYFNEKLKQSKFKQKLIFDRTPYNDYWMQSFEKIIDFCNLNNINLIVYVSPETYDYYKIIDIEKRKTYHQKLAQYTSFYDFSGENEITLNHNNFYDYIHFNELISLLIVDRIFNQNKDDTPKIKDFGTYIKKSK